MVNQVVGEKAKMETLCVQIPMQRDHGQIRRKDDLFKTVSGARDSDTNDRRVEPHTPSMESLSYDVWFRRDGASWTRVRQAQHRTMACAINRRRDVSDDWILSVGRVRSRAVWSQLRAVCVSKAGVDSESAGQAFPILRSSAHAFLERGACSAPCARIFPIAPSPPRPVSRFAFQPLFSTALFLTSAPADSTTFAGLGFPS